MYLDEISNDAIKWGIQLLEAPLLHLYNQVLNTGCFPHIWSDGLIIPLHKKNDKSCVDNYRGLIISSCVGKLFTKILTKRINKFMRINGLWKFNQCGFKADHRTEDNLFILNTIYEKYVNMENKTVYTAFVDFSKFFDKINRTFLLYKLLRYNISGKVYNIIKSMYSNTAYQILINGNLSPKLSASLGVKQGCCMSPILSNIFQNDLHDIFDDSDPIVLENVSFNSISWADDLLLMSTSKEGLQRCIDDLHGYCAKWGLEVNASKTKSMVLSKSHFVSENFRYGNADIECVKYIQYLGFSITYNLNLKYVMTDRIDKASKMADMVLRAIRTTGNVSVKLSLNIFDKQISPVVLYGSAIWATPKSFNLLYLDNQDEGENARTIASRVLYNILHKHVSIKYARRVGKLSSGAKRRILVSLKYYSDKKNILRQSINSSDIRNFRENGNNELEKLHMNYAKRTLNLSKYASNMAVQGELARFPLLHKAWGLAIKYWLRLCHGTSNVLLNAAFKSACDNEHPWLQSIKYLLVNNGFGDVFLDPMPITPNFGKIFVQRLNDQFQQTWKSNMNASNRFVYLNQCKNEYERSAYLSVIKNHEIRNIFTRLRVDMNILATCKYRKPSAPACPMCQAGVEDIEHFLLFCPTWQDLRNAFFRAVQMFSPSLAMASNLEKMNYILDLKCPSDAISHCCAYVKRVYEGRKKLCSD